MFLSSQMVIAMKPIVSVPLFSIPLLLIAATGSWAQAVPPTPAAVSEPVAAVAPVAEPATEATPAAVPAAAANKPAAVPSAAPASLSADAIARRPPSEWNALIDQREQEMQRLRQSSYQTWPSPYGSQMDMLSRRMENQMQGRMQQLQRRIDADRGRYQSPRDRASSDWWDYRRSQSRLQSLRTQEYLDRMIQRGMGPNRGYRGFPRAPGW